MSLAAMSLSGGLIILVAAIIRALGKNRLPRWAFTALWAVAALRLVLPVSVPSPWSVYTLFAAPALSTPTATAVPGTGAAAGHIPTVSQVDIIQNIPTQVPGMSVDLWAIAWALGAVICAVTFTVYYVRCRRAFRASLPVESECVGRWLAEHPLRRTVDIRRSDCVAAPLTYGVLRPVILLPRGMELDCETLDYVLSHELAHIRRLDAFSKLALAGVVCLHWFNPAVWLMYALAGRDMELACDEQVVRRHGPDARKAYAQMLLAMEEARGGFMPQASFFSRSAIEERIKSIMKIKPKSIFSILLAAVLVLGTVTAFATSAAAAEIPSAAAPPAEEPVQDTQITSEDAAMTELALRRLEDNYPNVVKWVRETYPDTVWWTWESYQAVMEERLEELESMLGKTIGSNSSGEVRVTQEMLEMNQALYRDTLEDIQNGWLVSKSIGGDTNTVICIDPADIAAGTGAHEYQLSIQLLDGTECKFGPYEKAGEMLAAIVPFLLTEVKAGNLDLDEARDIAARYEMQTEGISRGSSYDGTTYVQWDDCGFVEISEEDFDILFPTPVVEWWTAEEYAAWLEQEKRELQEVIGSQAWTSHDGWFTWTQEKIDETVAMYEQILEEIKNGALISKTVDGSGDVMLAGVIPEDSVGFSTAFSVEDDSIAAGVLEDRMTQWAEVLAPYAPFNVTYEYDPATDDFKLYWNGKEVRGITDEEAQLWISEHAGLSSYGDDAIELYAVYKDGKLAGVREATRWEQESWTRIRQAVGASGDGLVEIPPSEKAAE